MSRRIGRKKRHAPRPLIVHLGFLLAAQILLQLPPTFANGQQSPNPQSGAASELDEFLLQDPPASTTDTGLPETPPASPDQPGQSVDQATDSLTEISWKMEAASQRLAIKRNAAEGFQLQQEILRDLAEMLKNSASSQPQEANQQSASQQSEAEQAQSEGQQDESASGEGDPSDEESESSEGPQARQVQAALDKVWGHLPEQLRDQVRSASVESFLPKYERLIELYFRRLAEGETNESGAAAAGP